MNLDLAYYIIREYSPYPETKSGLDLVGAYIILYKNDNDSKSLKLFHNAIDFLRNYATTCYPVTKHECSEQISSQYLQALTYLNDYLNGLDIIEKLTI